VQKILNLFGKKPSRLIFSIVELEFLFVLCGSEILFSPPVEPTPG
jgi:hypothetical protein